MQSLRYFIDLTYKGKRYHGWQDQPRTDTVQGILAKVMTTVLRQEINLTGAGRTDTGVHAEQMIAHFDTVELENIEKLIFNLNSFLPPDIAINDIYRVKDDAHARFDAVQRTYQYRIIVKKDPFLVDYAYLIHQLPDIRMMNKAAEKLLTYADFECFSRSGTDVKTFRCELQEAYWTFSGEELVFTITADRFLRNMVRAIVGTLLEIGRGTLPLTAMDTIVKSKDRSKAGPSVPAHGLFLTRIIYPELIKKI